MKKVFFLAFLLPVILFSQIQVSDIDYQLPRDDYGRKGFMKVGEEEYFIEQGLEGTRVSQVKNDQLEFLHEMNYRPSDSQLNFYAYSFEKSNSGLIYEGSILYEIYWDYIYMIDVVSGELQEVIDLHPYDVRIQQRFYYGENYFYFMALGNGWNGNVRIDRNTGLLDKLVNGGIVVASNQYWVSDDNGTLKYYDLESNQSLEHPFQFSNIEYIRKHDSDSNSRLIIKDEDGIHLLRDNHTIQTLSCNLPSNSQLSYVSDTRLAYTTHTGTELIFSVIDLENCTEVYTMEFTTNAESISIYTDEQLFDEYFIFGFPNDWQGDGYFYLFDIAANDAAFIDIPIDIPYLDRAVRYGNSLYFLTSNHLHYIGSLLELYRLDLSNYQTERISEQDIYDTGPIVIGESQNDMELNVYYGIEGTASLLQIDNEEQSLEEIESFNLFKNHGIHHNIYADLWVDNKYFFSTSEAIFVMQDDVTTKLLDIGPNVHGSSAYRQKGDFVYVLTGLDGAHYALKINIKDLSYSKLLLPGVEYLYYKRATSDNAIVNLSHNFTNGGSTGFFDLDYEEFITFEDMGLAQGSPGHLSGNNVLYRTTASSGGDWFLINTVTREVILTEIQSGTYPDPYPDGGGGFYLDDWTYADIVSFMHLDSDGELTEIYENFDHSVFYSGDKFDGQVKSLAFDGPDEMIIVSTKEGEERQKTIIDNGLLYYQNFFWYESDQVSFLEIYNGDSYDTYTFTFESNPENITPSGREDRLVSVLEETSYAILVYKNDQHVLSFERYDYASGNTEQLSELQSVRNSSIDSHPLKISGSKYLISLDDAIHGLEPWIFDIVTGEVQILKDIRQGIGSSNAKDYTIDPLSEEVYFTAIKTEGERQLFKLDQLLISTEELNEVTASDLHIYPIPASTHIYLGKDFENVFIMSIDGKIVSQIGPYVKDSKIAVEGLLDGLYLIQAQSKHNQVEVGKFIIQR
jgi:ELWxxDGT repeat protein